MKKPAAPVAYADYLQLEKILFAQALKSAEHGKPAHDEHLFIVIHQVYELWFKQILFELDAVLATFGGERVPEEGMGIAVARLQRITEIQNVMVDQLRVLETMTPLDFLDFRDYLIPASGFQSLQFRLVEIKLGLRQEQRLPYDERPYHARLTDDGRAAAMKASEGPSLFLLLERWLERTPFLDDGNFRFWEEYRKSVDAMLAGDRCTIETNPLLSPEDRKRHLAELEKTQEHFALLFDDQRYGRLLGEGGRRLSRKATLSALFIHLYRDEPILQSPFRFLTAVVDVDDLLTTWRYRHSQMVFRMIGMRMGTGGSSGHQYLRRTVDQHRIFADLAGLSTFMIPRSALPPLPDAVARKMRFADKSAV